MDWTATILAATGTAPDPAFPLDGVDLLPVCTGARAPFDRTLFWRTDARQAARQGRWKYLKDGNAERLFDLSIDPGEKNDLRANAWRRLRAAADGLPGLECADAAAFNERRAAWEQEIR